MEDDALGASTQPLSDDQVETVIQTALYAAETGQTQEQLERVLEWARQAQIDYAMLQMVLKREAGMYVREGELTLKPIKKMPNI